MAVTPGSVDLPRLAASMQPSLFTDGAPAGVIREADKPKAKRIVDAEVTRLRGFSATVVSGLKTHIDALSQLSAKLGEPGDLDLRDPVYREAQQAGLQLDPRSIDASGITDFRLTPDELDNGTMNAAGMYAIAVKKLTALEGTGAAAHPEQLARAREDVAAKLAEVVKLRELKVLATLQNVTLPTSTNIDVHSVLGLFALRDALDLEAGTLRATPGDAVEKHDRMLALAAARSAVAMALGGPYAQAQGIFDSTWMRPHTKSDVVKALIAVAHANGTLEQTDDELGRLMGAWSGEQPDADTPHGAITKTIDTQMSFIDKDAAKRILATGHDDHSNSDFTYMLDALKQPADALANWVIDNPGKTAGAAAGSVVAAAALPAEAVAWIASLSLGASTIEAGRGAYGYMAGADREEQIAGLYTMGRGLDGMALAAMPLAPSAAMGVRTAAARVPDVARSAGSALIIGARRGVGYLGKMQDLGVAKVVDEPRVVYRVAYSTPKGTSYEYASSSYDDVAAIAQKRPGAKLYVGYADDDNAVAVQAPRMSRTYFLVTGYRWMPAAF